MRHGTRGNSDMLGQKGRISLGPEANVEQRLVADSTELRRFDESSVLRHQGLSSVERCCVMLYYQWGFNEKEIADCFGFTESRASQVKSRAEEKISGSLSLEESRDRERQKQAAVSRQIQRLGFMDEEAERKLAEVGERARPRVVLNPKSQIQEILCQSFAVYAF